MLSGARRVGAFAPGRPRARPFGEDAVARARIFADPIAIAIGKAGMIRALAARQGREAPPSDRLRRPRHG